MFFDDGSSTGMSNGLASIIGATFAAALATVVGNRRKRARAAAPSGTGASAAPTGAVGKRPPAPDWAAQEAEKERKATVEVAGERVRFRRGVERAPVQEFTLAEIRSVSLVTRSRLPGLPSRYLDVRTGGIVQIPLVCQGFRAIPGWFGQLPGFPERYSAAVANGKLNERAPLWRRDLAANAALQADAPESLREEFLRGFWLGDAGAEQFVSWDSTYEEIAAAGERAGFPMRQELPFWYVGPVRWGALRFEQMKCFGNLRQDVPPTQWEGEVALHPATGVDAADRNFWELKEYFERLLGQGTTVSSAATVASLNHTWSSGGLQLQMTYWHNTVNTPETGVCNLQLQNKRPYTEYLHDAYTDGLTIEGVRLARFACGVVGLPNSFRYARWLRATPAAVHDLLLGRESFAVWRDEAAGRIGFAGPEMAVVIPLAEVRELHLRNAKPGMGNGWSALEVVDRAGKKQGAGSLPYLGFDPLADEIARVLGMPVVRQPEIVDNDR